MAGVMDPNLLDYKSSAAVAGSEESDEEHLFCGKENGSGLVAEAVEGPQQGPLAGEAFRALLGPGRRVARRQGGRRPGRAKDDCAVCRADQG